MPCPYSGLDRSLMPRLLLSLKSAHLEQERAVETKLATPAVQAWQIHIGACGRGSGASHERSALCSPTLSKLTLEVRTRAAC